MQLALPALAQQLAAPDSAEAFRRQQERQQREQEQLQRAPDVHLQSPEISAIKQRLSTDETPCFTIERIEMEGAQAQRFAWLKDALIRSDDSPVHKCIGAIGISIVQGRGQDALLAKGFVTSRVLVAAQDLSKGTLVLTVLPGRIGATRFDAVSSPRGAAWNAVPAHAGDILNLRDIEQALENFKRVPTVDASIDIAPGAGTFESDLVISFRQAKPLRLNASFDDSGSKSSGKYQGALTLSYDNWWSMNDVLYLTLNHDLGGGMPGARGTRGHTVYYAVPYGYWLLGGTVSRNVYYQTVAGVAQNYVYSGVSTTAELKLQRLIYRDARRKTTLSLSAFQRTTNNFIDDSEVQVQRRVVGGWDFGVNHKEFFKQATLEGNLNYKRGTGAFGSLVAPEQAFGEGTSRLGIITADANLTLPFALKEQQFKFNPSWRWQMNRTPLSPQDRFAIGGRYTVRGFDGELSLAAERGWLLRNDFSMLLGASNQELYLGLDHGEVQGPSSALLVAKRLSGAAIGVRGQFKKIQYDIFGARPINRPSLFRTASSTAGFSLNLSY